MVATSLLFTAVAPTYALSSSVAAPALAGLPSAPAPDGESSGEGAANVSPYDVNNVGGAGLMALAAGGDEPKSAKFEPPETPYNGAFTRGFDLEVPPFFELTPKLRLSYNSGDNRQHAGDGFSMLGVGWSLSGGGLIERKSSRGGLPKFDATDKFELDGNGLLDCVVDGATRDAPSCSAGGTHTARYETYERIKYIAGTNSWEITARDGRVSLYKALATFAPAGTEDARLRNDYHWLLQAVTDTDGNTISYSYDCAALPTCYVTTLSYGSSAVQFFWETRTDTFTHATGISLANVTKRLKTVSVRNSSSLVRAYAFTYSYSPNTKRSLLSSLKQYGSDAAVSIAGVISGGTILPADTFTYWDMSSRNGVPMSALYGAQAVNGDFNGDNKLDGLVWSSNSAHSSCSMYFASQYPPSGDWLSGAVGLCPDLSDSAIAGVLVADFNGDGTTDLQYRRKWSSQFPPQPYRSNFTTAGYGSGDWFFVTLFMRGSVILATAVNPAGAHGQTNRSDKVMVGDFNGDGLNDFLYGDIFISTGADFSRQSWANQGYGVTSDFNGDGLTDIISTNATSGQLNLRISTGDAFTVVPVGLQGSVDDKGGGVGDLNADGYPDLVAYASHGYAFLHGTGSGFVSAGSALLSNPDDGLSPPLTFDTNFDGSSEVFQSWSHRNSGGTGTITYGSRSFIRAGSNMVGGCSIPSSPAVIPDRNGDGRAEIGEFAAPYWGGGFSPACFLSDSVAPDLLKRHTLSSGGTVDVEFLPSTYWTNGYLPFVVQAVSNVTTSDGRGNSSKVKYAYEGGTYDAFERRFLGFAKVTAELPCEADETTCPWVHAWYRQEAVAAGSLSKLEVYAPNGQIQRRVENGYVVNQTSAPFTAFKTSEQVTDFVAGGNPVSRKEWTYDGYANLVEEKDLGIVGWTGDDLTTSTSYELNLGAYLVGRPGRVTATDANGTLLRDTQVFYDGATTAGVEPTKGHATTTRKWLSSESRWIAAMAEYDSYGQPTAETDALGNRTERLYDTTHQFVTEERNPLWFDGDTRQKQLATWKVSCAAPLTQTDGNGLVTSYQYDALCRQTRVDYPSGEYQVTAFFNLGTATTQYVETTKSPADGVNPIWSRTYLDGLGRTYKQTSVGATAVAQPVVTETKYTKRGEVLRVSLPYFQGSTAQWTTTKFDVLSRPVLVTLPDSKTVTRFYSAIAYAAGYLNQTGVTDPLGRTKYQRSDAAGRVIQDIGQVGTDWVVSSFDHNPLGEMTFVTDPTGNRWINSYDTLGRRAAANDPDLSTWTYTYDDAGRLLTQTDAKGQVTAFGYDRLGRVLTKTSGLGLPNQEIVTNTYDEARSGYFNIGQLTTAANDNAVSATITTMAVGRRAWCGRWMGSPTPRPPGTTPAGG